MTQKKTLYDLYIESLNAEVANGLDADKESKKVRIRDVINSYTNAKNGFGDIYLHEDNYKDYNYCTNYDALSEAQYNSISTIFGFNAEEEQIANQAMTAQQIAYKAYILETLMVATELRGEELGRDEVNFYGAIGSEMYAACTLEDYAILQEEYQKEGADQAVLKEELLAIMQAAPQNAKGDMAYTQATILTIGHLLAENHELMQNMLNAQLAYEDAVKSNFFDDIGHLITARNEALAQIVENLEGNEKFQAALKGINPEGRYIDLGYLLESFTIDNAPELEKMLQNRQKTGQKTGQEKDATPTPTPQEEIFANILHGAPAAKENLGVTGGADYPPNITGTLPTPTTGKDIQNKSTYLS